MKKVVAGGIFMISGIILFLAIHIPAARHASNLGNWNTPPGRLGTALESMGGTIVWNNSIILIISGVILILWGCFGGEIGRLIKSISQQNLTKNKENHDDKIRG